MLHSRWINGALAYWDTHQCRIVEAIGPSVNKWDLDPKKLVTNGTSTISGYTVTVVTGGANDSIAVGTAVPGDLVIVTADQENDGFNVQLQGEGFKLASGKPLYFGIKLKISDATQSDFLVGLCETNTTPLTAVDTGAYFRKVDGATACTFVLEKDTTETEGAAAAIANDTFVTLEFFFDGTSVDYFVDGVLKTRLAQTNLPDDEEVTPTIEVLAGAAANKTLTIEWARCVQFN